MAVKENIDLGSVRVRLSQVARFMGYIRPYWDKQLVIYICMGFSLILALGQPYLTSLIIDYALIGRDFYLFNMLLLVGVLFYIFSVPIELLNKYMGFYIRTKVSFRLRSEFYRRLQRLSFGFNRSRPVGEQLYRVGPDIDGVSSMVVETVPGAAVAVVRFVLLFGVCLWLSWKLTLAVLAAAPLIYCHVHYFSKRLYGLGKERTERSQEVTVGLQEALSQLRLIRIFGKERAEERRYVGDLVDLIRIDVKTLRVALFQSETGRILNTLITGAVTYYLGYRLIKGHLSFGEMTALIMYLFMLLSSIKAFGGIYKDMVMKFIVVDRVLETLDATGELPESPNPAPLGAEVASFVFEGVSFGFNEGQRVLNELSFNVDRGGVTALVGVSGAGKTTLTHLLLRLYDTWDGSVLIDGLNVKDIRTTELRKRIAYASNSPDLLRRSIRDNIAFADPDIDDDVVIRAAKTASAHGFINDLPNGYDTIVGEGGHTLSQGERQRISLARALAAGPRVLVLDEALSSVSSDVEREILAGLKTLARAGEFIPLIISHRLSAVREADQILLLHDGAIRESGTHNELLIRRGLYAKLYESQLPPEVSGPTGPPIRRVAR